MAHVLDMIAARAEALFTSHLSDREIATALYVGVETVKTHLRNVFVKLGLRNRVEATMFVQRSGAFVRYQPADPRHPDAALQPPTSEPPTPE